MGKAVPKGIKAKAEEIQKYFPDKVTDSFDQNKALLNSLGLPLPKTNRNLKPRKPRTSSIAPLPQ